MEIFLNIIQALSDSRFWLMPILLICTVVISAVEIIDIAREVINDKL